MNLFAMVSSTTELHKGLRITQRCKEMEEDKDRLIDLHGLHVNEAIHVQKHDLTMLRIAARPADQHFQVYISAGTGHHTRGFCTPARPPTAVQHLYQGQSCCLPLCG